MPPKKSFFDAEWEGNDTDVKTQQDIEDNPEDIEDTKLADGFHTINYSSGNVYVGDVLTQMMHGKGTYTYAGGEKEYVGEFENHAFHGKGSMTDKAAKTSYEGEWENNKKHGQGVNQMANGDKFDGTFTENQLTKGKYTYADGRWYDGEFQKGIKHGQGTLKQANGDLCEGTFEEGKMTGNAVINYASKKKFVGRVINGKKVKGKLTFVDGSYYDGDFCSDKPDGVGERKFKDGDLYKGEWRGGQMEGTGRMDMGPGKKYASYDGAWKAGKFHGVGTVVTSTGVRLEADWMAGTTTKQFPKSQMSPSASPRASPKPAPDSPTSKSPAAESPTTKTPAAAAPAPPPPPPKQSKASKSPPAAKSAAPPPAQPKQAAPASSAPTKTAPKKPEEKKEESAPAPNPPTKSAPKKPDDEKKEEASDVPVLPPRRAKGSPKPASKHSDPNGGNYDVDEEEPEAPDTAEDKALKKAIKDAQDGGMEDNPRLHLCNLKGSEKDEARERLIEFYKENDPKEVAKVAKLMFFHTTENDMMHELRKKYKVQPKFDTSMLGDLGSGDDDESSDEDSQSEPLPPQQQQQQRQAPPPQEKKKEPEVDKTKVPNSMVLLCDLKGEERADAHKRLKTFYNEYNPTQMEKVDMALDYAMTEEELMSKLKEKYCPHLNVEKPTGGIEEKKETKVPPKMVIPERAAQAPMEKEGFLGKFSLGKSMFTFGGNWQKRYFILDDRGFSYYKCEFMKIDVRGGNTRPAGVCKICNDGSRLVTRPTPKTHKEVKLDNRHLMFVIVYQSDETGTMKEYKLLCKADTEAEKKSWCASLERNVDEVDSPQDFPESG